MGDDGERALEELLGGAAGGSKQGQRVRRPRKGEPPGPIRRVHLGHLKTVPFLVASVGLVAIGLSYRAGEGGETGSVLAAALVFAASSLVAMAVLGFHERCPSCRGLFARQTLQKVFSHTATESYVDKDSSGQPQLRQRTRNIYHGTFRCRRCDHGWAGYL